MNLKRLLVFLKKEKIKIITFALLLFTPFAFASAAPWDPVVKGLLLLLIVMILGIISLLGFVLGTLSKIFLSMLTETVRWAGVARIGNLSFTNRTQNPLIDAGLKVTLPLANMAFILIFVVIAIATILGVENYTIRRTLPVLIIMALLVNFAPVLVGLMVDAGNVITYYFLKGVDFTNFVEVDIGQVGRFIRNTAIAFARAFKAAGYAEYIGWALTGVCGENATGTDCNELANNNEIPGGIMLPTLYLAGSAASMAIAIITLVMAIGMFLVRNLIIWILVILSPLAFAAYVLPSTRKAFQSWWHQLLQWTFIGVSLSFFLYLATVMSYAADKIEITAPSGESVWANMINNIATMVVKTMFPAIIMMLGLFLSAQGGNKFAGIAIGQTKKFGNWAKGLGAGMGLAAAGYVGAKSLGGAKGFFGKEGTYRYKLARSLERSKFIPIKPGTLTGYRREEVEKKTDELKKEFKMASTNELKDRAEALSRKKIYGKERTAEARALLAELTARGDLDESYAPLVRALEKQGFNKEAKDAKKLLPTLAIKKYPKKSPTEKDRLNRAALEDLYRGMTTEDRRKVQPDAYKNPLVYQAAISTITDRNEFAATISNYKAARNIGLQLPRDINVVKKQNPIVAEELRKEKNQRKMGINIVGDRILPA